jgi:hypothetical protein
VDGGISKHAQEVWMLVQFALREDALWLLRVFLWLFNIAWNQCTANSVQKMCKNRLYVTLAFVCNKTYHNISELKFPVALQIE